MKKISVLLSLLFVLTLFVSCSTEKKGVDSSASSQTQNASLSTLDESIKKGVDSSASSQTQNASSPTLDESIKEGVDSSASSQTQNASSPTLDESIKEDISDLPAHLYQTTEMRTALSLRYDFEITEPTSLEINVSTISGKLSIGVKNRNTDTYVLELTECTKEKYNQVVSLEETGQYSIVLETSNHTGSYEVVGTPITKKVAFLIK